VQMRLGRCTVVMLTITVLRLDEVRSEPMAAVAEKGKKGER